jgi:diguanylate cyclase (GGDEF)-like protein
MRTLSTTQKRILFVGLLLGVVSVGMADYATGAELAFSIFYFFPVGVAAWYIGWKTGVLFSLESAVSWYAADILARPEPYSTPYVPVWNTVVRLFTFITITILIGIIRNILDREALQARIDYLTRAANARAFYEAVETQIYLFGRNHRPFSILYLDMDDLKRLNDASGHSIGDQALRATVSTLKRALRPNDTIARMGGDEFAVLLPEADVRGVGLVTARIQSALRQNPGKQFRVTFSIGALTCLSAPGSMDDLLEKADQLMYEAKRGGKDAIRSATYEPARPPSPVEREGSGE